MESIIQHVLLLIFTHISFHLNAIMGLGGVNNLFPNLPAGAYNAYVKAMSQCSSTLNNKHLLDINFYLSRSSVNTTEYKGNVTFKVPLDDTISVDVNFAVKDSIGGWKENALLYKSTTACTDIKKYLGASFKTLMKSLGLTDTCPIPAGVHVLNNLDMSTFYHLNFTKEFFYGTYKCRYVFSKNKEIHGCIIFVTEVKRPWE